MSKNEITDVRQWLAATINNIFKDQAFYNPNDLDNNIFYIYNLKQFNGPKKILINRTNKAYRVKVEKWMTKDILFKIWIFLNNKKIHRDYYFIKNLYRTSSTGDIWISLGPSKQEKDISSQLIQIMKAYKNNKNLETVQALIGGTRKYFNAYRVSIELIFCKKWINKISDLYNGFNFTHNNLIGEESHNKDGTISINSINSQIKNMPLDDIFRICDYLINSLNIILNAVQNENLIRK